MKRKMTLVASMVMVGSLVAIPNLSLAQFVTLDKHSDNNQVGIQFGFTIPDENDVKDTFALRTEIYGQYYHKWLGGYVSLPINTLVMEDADDHRSLGNLQLGIFHTTRLSDSLAISARLGFSVPTAGDDPDDVFTNAVSSYYQLGNMIPESTDAFSLRPSVSLIFDSDLLFARCDLGIDFVMPDKGDNVELIRLNLGVGAHLGLVDLAAELSNLAHLEEDGGDSSIEERMAHNLALQVSVPLPFIKPYIAYVTPLDDDVRGEIHAVTIGVNGTF